MKKDISSAATSMQQAEKIIAVFNLTVFKTSHFLLLVCVLGHDGLATWSIGAAGERILLYTVEETYTAFVLCECVHWHQSHALARIHRLFSTHQRYFSINNCN